jgi:hypothetical protein
MANYGDGNWHAATLGQFIGQLVDEGDTAVVFKLDAVTPHETNVQSNHYQVILVADGHLSNYLPRCVSIHKTLRALLDAGLAE